MSGSEAKDEWWKAALQEVVVTDFLDFRKYLLALYMWHKDRRDAYSYLQFAVDVGFPKTNAIRLVVAGKRPLSLKGAGKIADALKLTARHKHYFETLVLAAHVRQSKTRDESYAELVELKRKATPVTLEKRQLEFFSAWYHSVILEMMACPDFRSDPDWLSAQIQPHIRREQARRSLALLQDLGLAAYDKKTRRHYATAKSLSSGSDVESLALVRYHQQMMDLGKESIVQIEESQREISSLTFSISAAGAELVKDEVRKFSRRIIDLVSSMTEPVGVHQLNIQFFPVTKGDPKK